ncbi:MAG: methionyl-tRNA formyltransferase, partial [Aestuariivirgaceae bacterium]|nr:methionyl-tRNA formyltransferase [Aestuariivirgaceae bacterium]
GRGLELRKSAVQMKAETLGLEVRHPATLKDEGAAFAALQADAAIVVAYGLLLPAPILEGVKHGCFNLHPSLLPRWRGAAPLQRAIMGGDAQTGVAVMRMEAGLDTGPICLEEKFPLHDSITAAELHDQLAVEGARLMVEAMAKLEAGTLDCHPQSETGITYAAKISKAEAKIDFTKPAPEVLRHIHGLSPFPGAWTNILGHRVKILKAERAEHSGTPARTVDDDLTITCGEGAIRPLRLQREGKQAAPRDAFLRGLAVAAGTDLT